MDKQNEKKVFQKILSCSSMVLPTFFNVHDEGNFYRFTEKSNPSHYITVDKTRKIDFWVPVNSNFGFDRPAGSNNYPELIDISKHLIHAFNLSVNW